MGTWSSPDTPAAPVLINLSHHLCPLRPSPCPQIPGLLHPAPAGRSLPAADNNAPSSSGSTQLRALRLLLSSSPSALKGRPHFDSPLPAAETEPQSSYYEQADTGRVTVGFSHRAQDLAGCLPAGLTSGVLHPVSQGTHCCLKTIITFAFFFPHSKNSMGSSCGKPR